MSSTSLYASHHRYEPFEEVSSYKNSHGFAPMIWDALCRKYFREKMREAFDYYGNVVEDLWRYETEGGFLQPWERNALRTTYDRAVVLSDDMRCCAHSLFIFAQAHGHPDHVCSLIHQSHDIREAYLQGMRAVAWHQTSITDNWLYPPSDLDEDDPDWTDEPNPVLLSQKDRYEVAKMMPLLWVPAIVVRD